jgi:hypothetical protein
MIRGKRKGEGRRVPPRWVVFSIVVALGVCGLLASAPETDDEDYDDEYDGNDGDDDEPGEWG